MCVCAILSSPRCLAQGPSILFFVAGGQAQARACVCVCVSYYFILRAPHIGALRLPLSSLCRRQSLCVQMCLCVCPTTSSTSHRSTALSLIFVSHKRPSSCLYKCLCVYVYVPYHFKHLTQEHCPFPIICFTQEAKLVFVYVFVFVCACVCMCMCPTTSSTSHRSTALYHNMMNMYVKYSIVQEAKLVCVPYYQILGVSKCGTTDLYHRLSQHPQVFKAANKVRFRSTKYMSQGCAKPCVCVCVYVCVADRLRNPAYLKRPAC